MLDTFLILAQATGDVSENPALEVAREFGWKPSLFIAQVICFTLVALLLKKFAYKPIVEMLEQRKNLIADSLENAEKIKEELSKTQSAREEILRKANEQATKLISEAKQVAGQVRDTETQKAIASAEQIISKAREAAEADHARMLTELKREVGRLVVQTTAKVVGKSLTDADQKRLIEESEKELTVS